MRKHISLQDAARCAMLHFQESEKRRADANEAEAKSAECPECAEKDKRLYELLAAASAFLGAWRSASVSVFEVDDLDAAIRKCEKGGSR